jgi:hypothetical protein
MSKCAASPRIHACNVYGGGRIRGDDIINTYITRQGERGIESSKVG